jgi:hypothetical protein
VSGRVAGVAAAVALLAGCGSYTKADFVASANAICAAAVRATRALPPPRSATGASSPGALSAYLQNLLPVVRAETKQLLALQRPTGNARERAALVRYLAAVSTTLADYTHLAQAAERRDGQGVAAAQSRLRSSPVAALAGSYGLRSCANPGATVS